MSLAKPNLILIVADSSVELTLLSTDLRSLGCRVVVATDEKSTLELLHQLSPLLIFLELGMSNNKGLAIYQALQQSTVTQDIPIVLIADTHDDPQTILESMDLEEVDCLTKPFNQKKILNRLRLQMRLRTLTLKLQEQNRLLMEEIQARKASEVAWLKLAQELEHRVEERAEELAKALQELQRVQKDLVERESSL